MTEKTRNELLEDIADGTNLGLNVTMGKIPQYSTIDKYGDNPLVVATEAADIWEVGGIYPYDADGTAPIVSLVSTAPDTVPIRVEGLNTDGEKVVQIITLTGTTRVALTTPLWRVYRMENEGDADLVGIVTCYIGTGETPAVGAERAQIVNGNNQTLMAIYTIPKGKVGFLFRGEVGCGLSGAGGTTSEYARVCYRSRRYGKIFKIKKTLTVSINGSSIYKDNRSFPDIIPSLTDIKLCAEYASEDMNIWGTFDIMLVDEAEFSDAYLKAIGQPGY